MSILCGFGSCLFLCFREIDVELNWILCSINGGDFEYVKVMSMLLTTTEPPIFLVSLNPIWHKEVPLKVSIFVWRLLRDRLSIKDNLHRHNIIPHDNMLCDGGSGMEETTKYLFLSCPLFGFIWPHLHHWVGILAVDPSYLIEHFLQFG